MLSDLQSQKARYFFKRFDNDEDGYVERADMEEHVRRLAEYRGLAPGNPTYDELLANWMLVWESLQKVADQNRDNLVSPSEWLALIDATLQSEDLYQMVMNSIGNKTFDALDLDDDGYVGAAEWRALLHAYRADEASAAGIFARLDTDGDGRLSREEGLRHLRDFFYSSDPDSPGNQFFGPL